MKTNIIDSIAVFILATTRPFGGTSSYESRIIPSAETWLKPFLPENVYFVMGTNFYDYSFLKKECVQTRVEGVVENEEEKDEGEGDGREERQKRKQKKRKAKAKVKAKEDSTNSDTDTESLSKGRRRLGPKTKQAPLENVRYVYECDYSKRLPTPHQEAKSKQSKQSKQTEMSRSLSLALAVQPSSSSSSLPSSGSSTLNVLYTGNCTGEYFGYGPACRCQEAMRFYLYNTRLTRSSAINTRDAMELQSEAQRETHKGKEGGQGMGLLNNNNRSLFENVRWFLFIDDDLYLRPYALRALLSNLLPAATSASTKNKNKGKSKNENKEDRDQQRAVALVSSGQAWTFKFSRKWNKTTVS